MKKSKIAIAISIIVVLVVVIASVTYALFTDRKKDTANIIIGDIKVELKEDWPEGVDEYGINRNTKKVWGKSTEQKKAYVRMRFIPIVQYKYSENTGSTETISEWRTAPVSQDNMRVSVMNDDNWVLQDGYYYYKKILNPGEETDKLDLQWEIYQVPSSISNYENIRADVKVILEYSQVSNEKWKDIFKIENLPAGVEVFEGQEVM